jgi:protocadherin Fat 4
MAFRSLPWTFIFVSLVCIRRTDCVPVFTEDSYIQSIAEEQEIGTSVAKVTALDSLLGLPSKDYVYSILSGQDSDAFWIDNTTGVIYNRVRLDREAFDNQTGTDKETYQFRVRIRDSSANTDSASVAIHLIDINDHHPDFQQAVFAVNLLEDSGAGTVVVTVSAHDPDEVQRSQVLTPQPDGTSLITYRYDVDNGRVLYSLIAGHESGYFQLDSETGTITLTSAANGHFDVRLNQQFNLTIRATDGGGLTNTTTVLIQIVDANDHAPVIIPPSVVHFNLSEDTPSGVILINSINVTDNDFGVNAKVTFAITSGSDGFEIDPQTGQIQTANSLDRDSPQGPVLSLVVSARDGGSPSLEDKITFFVSLTDVNDNPPMFSSDPIVGSVLEGAFGNTEVLILKAQDPDEGINASIAYSLISGDKGRFSLNTITGSIRTLVVLDREEQAVYSLTVTANDLAVNESLRLTSTVRVEISVIDLNDNVPQFEQSSYYQGILDNTTIGSSVLQIQATDRDSGSNAEIRYETLTAEKNAFDIEEDSGIIRSRRTFSYQSKSLYTISIRAWDKGALPRFTDTMVTVEIHDVNENPPVFVEPEYNVSISEDTPTALTILQVSARDRDHGPIGEITYHVISAPQRGLFDENAGTFDVNRSSGEVFVNSSLDRDQSSVIVFRIAARDGGFPFPFEDTTLVRVTLDDINDVAPYFPTPVIGTVKENQSPSIPFMQVSATDPDSSSGGIVSYEIRSGNILDSFIIDNVTGVVTTNRTLDREAIPEYVLTLAMRDHGQPPLLGYGNVTIVVGDENDNGPYFVGNFSGEITEGTAPGAQVAVRVRALDLDIGSNAQPSYTIIAGDGLSRFAIDSFTGEVTSTVTLDKEEKSRYTLTVKADDGAPFHRTATTHLFVSVGDSNDNPPVFTQRVYSGNVSESSAIGTEIISIFATDADTGTNAEITYSIERNDTFGIYPQNGTVYVSGHLDRETNAFYVVLVMATDGGLQPASDTALINITLVDANDNPPVFVQNNYSAAFSEDVTAGYSITTVSAYDFDVDRVNSDLTYVIGDGDPHGWFIVHPFSGVITVAKSPDREAIRFPVVTIVAIDKGTPSLTGTSALHIELFDVNDSPPVFASSHFNISVPENSVSMTPVDYIIATDPDVGENATVRFRITKDSSRPWSRFRINQTSGLITTRLTLNREWIPYYTLEVEATDRGVPQRTSHVGVTVEILDVNDNPPVFSEKLFVLSIPEDAEIGNTAGMLSSSDDDIGGNSEPNYTVIGGQDFPYYPFILNQSNGLFVTSAGLDREAQSEFRLEVKVSDKTAPEFVDYANVSIKITDVNDNTPTFTSGFYHRSIRENMNTDTHLLTVHATDRDIDVDGAIEYIILESDDSQFFSVHNESGVLKAGQYLDRDFQQDYFLTIMANNSLSSRYRASYVNVSIHLEDINDNKPTVGDLIVRYTVPEDTVTGTVVFAVPSTDPDKESNGTQSFELVFESHTGVFLLDHWSGNVTLNTSLDREVQDSYVIGVRVYDLADDPLNSSTVIYIDVTDVNDQVPFFPASSYYLSIPFTSIIASQVVKLAAVDLDLDTTSSLSYSIVQSNGTNVFSLVQASGSREAEIRVAQRLSSYAGTEHNFTVEVSDGKHTSQAWIFIDVFSTVTMKPVFLSYTYSSLISESSLVGSSVLTVTAMPVGASFAIVSGDRDGHFNITSSGIIQTAALLDYETKSVYKLGVSATNADGTAYALARITVQDSNDHSPEFVNKLYKVEVAEATTRGAVVLQVKARDADTAKEASSVRYTMTSSKNARHFLIDSISGNIYPNLGLDFESGPLFYTYTVTATNHLSTKKLTSSAEIQVTVTDSNDNKPQFPETGLDRSITEDTPVNTSIINVTATDRDRGLNGLISYTLSGDFDDVTFVIDSWTGEVKSGIPVDREKRGVYVLTVTAMDSGSPPQSSSIPLTINIIDLNDNAPVWVTETPYQAEVYEDVPIGFSIIDVSASDSDLVDSVVDSLTGIESYVVTNGLVTYTIASGDPQVQFAVDPSTGKVTTRGTLDREEQDAYRIVLNATDGGGRSTFWPLVITVLDANDNFPQFSQPIYFAAIPEDAPMGTNVIVITATDDDLDANSELDYSIVFDPGNNSSSLFEINGTTGVVKTAELLDRETLSLHSITVVATDRGNASLSTEVTLNISVIDLNDNTPSFVLRVFKGTVTENSAVNKTVLFVEATDPDYRENGTVLYRIVSGNSDGKFYIRPTTGEIAVSDNIDYETTQKYKLLVQARDTANETQQRSSTAEVTIEVNDTNDNKPVLDATSYAVSVPESAEIGTDLVFPKASDRDSGLNAITEFDLYYSSDVMAEKVLDIDTNTGIVRTKGKFDRELQDRFIVTLIVRDRGVPSLSTNSSVLVTVTDVNDNTPFFSSSRYAGEVAEHSMSGTFVLQVTATDKDVGGNGLVRFSLQQPSKIYEDCNFNLSAAYLPSPFFSIDSESGNITVSGDLDREANHTLVVIATATDQPTVANESPHFSRSCILVTVTDINDNIPVFLQEQYSGAIEENKPMNTSILRIAAVDGDIGLNAEIRYQIADGPSSFYINSSSGIIYSDDEFDREMNNEYKITVVAVDLGQPPLNGLVPVVVTVTDVNEFSPNFVDRSGMQVTSYNGTVFENMPLGTSVRQVFTTDQDSGRNADVTYQFVRLPYSDHFILNASSGVITTARILDRENIATYQLEVLAVDDGLPQPLNSTVIVNVTVQDRNDEIPVFVQSNYSSVISERSPLNYTALTVSANDFDEGENGKIVYSLGPQLPDGDHFSINPTSGSITVIRGLDRESTDLYQITVYASDRGAIPLSSHVTVTVYLFDENDNHPIFSQDDYNGTVREDALNGTIVVQVNATDNDVDTANNTVHYLILSGNEKSDFEINSGTGEIAVSGKLDAETLARYDFLVLASDGTLNSTAAVTVYVLNANDNRPIFGQRSYDFEVLENSPSDTYVCTVVATDGDNQTIKYSFVSNATQHDFRINSTTGQLNTSRPFDYETNRLYSFVVRATDQGLDGLQSSYVNVTVKILDLNDNSPVFNASLYSVSIYEDAPVNYVVLNVSATDIDSTSNGRVSYKLNRTEIGKDHFTVNPVSGAVFSTELLDRETTGFYLLHIIAEDDGIPKKHDITAVEIKLLDVNDNAPVISALAYEAVVVENGPPFTSLIDLSAEDRDLEENSRVLFNITGGNEDGHFAVNSTTGLIYTSAPLDREYQVIYDLNVTAYDHGVPSLASTVQVRIIVSDLNDNHPSFSQQSFAVTVSESAILGSTVFLALATDPDDGTNSQLVYHISSGNTDLKFDIDQQSGVVSTAGYLDREITGRYDLIIQVTDGGTPTGRSSARLNVSISDINDHAPEFVSKTYKTSIAEDAVVGSLVSKLVATDADIGTNADLRYYIIVGNENRVFALDSSTGTVTLNRSLDYETTKVHVITVEARDGASSVAALRDSATLTVYVLDRNDHQPRFDATSFSTTLRSSTVIGSTVAILTAHDVDFSNGGSLTGLRYEIVSGNELGLIGVDEYSATVTTSRELVSQENATLVLNVSATDGEFFAYCTLLIHVVRDDTAFPLFSQTSFRTTVPEDVVSGTEIIRLNATGATNYSIVTDYVMAPFSVDYRGIVRATQQLDYEKTRAYSMSIKAIDEKRRESYTFLHVSVDDVNDNSPVFQTSLYTASLNETSGFGTSVIVIEASDSDSSSNADVTYDIESGDVRNWFAIDRAIGLIRTKSAIDRETEPMIVLNVSAVNSAAFPRLKGYAQVRIEIQDFNDNEPSFQRDRLLVSTPEDTPIGTTIHRTTASDPDAGLNGRVTYYLTTSDGDTFAVNDTTGGIYTLKKLNREQKSSYSLVITATDFGSPTRKDDSTTVHVEVTDINEFDPVFSSSVYTTSVPESSQVGAVVAAVSALDPDTNSSVGITYSISFGNEGGRFRIDETSGDLIISKILDFELQSQYVLLVSALDSGYPRLNSTVAVRISVVNQNEHEPVFTRPSYLKTISENIPINSSVITVTAKDADRNQTIVYQLTVNSYNERGEMLFDIDEMTGEISIAAPIDREFKKSHTLFVTAIDTGFSTRLSTTVRVTLYVSDQNDNTPIFIMEVINVTVPRNPPPPLFVTQFDSTDLDEFFGTVRFSLVSGNEDGFFRIDNVTGKVFTVDTLGDDAKNLYNITVQASDGMLSSLAHLLVLTTFTSDYCLPQICYLTEESFEDDRGKMRCPQGWIESNSGLYCSQGYCSESSKVVCPANQTCIDMGRPCNGSCLEEGHARCPTTDFCERAGINTSHCDEDNTTCYDGYVRMRTSEGSEWCQKVGTLDGIAQVCVNRDETYCVEKDICVNMSVISGKPQHPCQLCPNGVIACPDTYVCVHNLSHCCPFNQTYCNLTGACLNESQICVLPNTAPTILSPLIFLGSFDDLTKEKGVSVEFLMATSGYINTQQPVAFDRDSDRLSLAITESDGKSGLWEYALCTNSDVRIFSLCAEVKIDSSVNASEIMRVNDSCCSSYDDIWYPITNVDESNSLALPLLSRIRLRKYDLFQGAAWFKFKVWDGSEGGILSKSRYQVVSLQPTYIHTKEYDSSSSFSQELGVAMYLVHPRVYVPTIATTESDIVLPSVIEDMMPIDNTGVTVTEMLGGGVILPYPVIYVNDTVSNLPQNMSLSHGDLLDRLPLLSVKSYFDDVNNANRIAQYRLDAYALGTNVGAAIAFDPDDETSSRWQISTSGLTTTWTYLNTILQEENEYILVNVGARLRFVPVDDFSGMATIRIRPWDGAYNTRPGDNNPGRIITAIINSTTSASLSVTKPDWRQTVRTVSYGKEFRAVLDVTGVPDEPILTQRSVILDVIPHRILYEYDHLFTATVDMMESEFRPRKEEFRRFLVLTLDKEALIRRAQRNVQNTVDVSFEVEKDALNFVEIKHLINTKINTLGQLGFNITAVTRKMAAGTGAGCNGFDSIRPGFLKGTLVNDMVTAAFNDTDRDFLGAAITSAPPHPMGVWMYHLSDYPESTLDPSWTPDQARWLTFPSIVTSTRALLLNGHDRIRFVPHPDYHWSDPTPQITFKAWDGTRGGRAGDVNINTDPYKRVTNSTAISSGIFSFYSAFAKAVRMGCDGVVGSGRQFDACCECGGNGSSCAGCNDTLGLNGQRDPCDECGALISKCLGCDFIPFSRRIADNCSVCGGNDTAPVDCAGKCFGTALIDQCGICSEGTTERVYNRDLDCAGDCNGTAEIDDCGECVNGTTGKRFNQAMDCRGVCGGDFIVDQFCGLCQDSKLGVIDYRDCAGTCFGVAELDECNVCVISDNGSVNSVSILDVCGVCGGNGTMCPGCDGVQGSGKTKDRCGVCGDNDCSCFKIKSIEPSRGPAKGGTRITVHGAGFTFNSSNPEKSQGRDICGGVLRDGRGDSIHAQCKLVSPSQQWEGEAQLIDHRTIVCTTPDSRDVSKRVTQFRVLVAIGRGPFNTIEDGNTIFTYDDTDSTRINDFFPSQGIIGKPTTVVFNGDALFDSEVALCLLSDWYDCGAQAAVIRGDGFIAVNATFVNSTRYQCVMPPLTSSCRVRVDLSLDGQKSGIVSANFSANFTYFASAPEIVNISFSDDVTSLVVVWDRAIDTVKGSYFNCIDIWDNTSYHLIGASTSSCSFQTYERISVIVLLGSAATISPGSALTVKNDTVWTLGETYSHNATDVWGMVSSPKHRLIPVSVIQGSDVVPACGNYTANGLLSYNAGYRDLEYLWAMATEDSDTQYFTELQQQLASFGRSASAIELESRLFVMGIQYYLELQVTNVLGETSSISRLPLTKVGVDAPIISIRGHSEQLLEVSKMAVFYADAKISDCGSAWSLSYSWRMFIPAVQRGTDDTVISLERNERSVLVIPPHTLQPDVRHHLQVDVYSGNGSSTASVTVRTVIAPIKAVIVGGNRTVSRNSTFILDASQSVDYAESPEDAKFQWECLWRQTVCFDVTDPLRRAVDILHEGVIEVDASRLAVGEKYLFTVTLRKGDRSDTATVEIVISDVIVPIVIIWPMYDSISPDKSVQIRATVFSSLPVIDTTWEVDQMPGFGFINLSVPAIKSTASKFNSYQFNLTDVSRDVAVFTNSTSQVNLVVKPGVLTFDVPYRFRLTAWNAYGFGQATVDVVVDKPPSSGRLLVKPARGDALDTVFVVEAEAWADIATDLPLAYQFGVKFRDGSRLWLTGKESTSILETTLPEGDGNDRELAVLVRVFDGKGAFAESTAIVAVYPRQFSAELVLADSKALVDLGHWSSGLARIASALSQMHKNGSYDNSQFRRKAAELVIRVYNDEIPRVDSQMIHIARLLEIATSSDALDVGAFGVDPSETEFVLDDTLDDSILSAIITVTQDIVDHFTSPRSQSTVDKRSAKQPTHLFPDDIYKRRLAMSDATTIVDIPLNILHQKNSPKDTASFLYETIEKLSLELCKMVVYGEEKTTVRLGTETFGIIQAVPGVHATSNARLDFGSELRDKYVRWQCSSGECQGVCIVVGTLAFNWLAVEEFPDADPTTAVSLDNSTVTSLLDAIPDANVSSVRLVTRIVTVSLADAGSGEILSISDVAHPIKIDFEVIASDVTENHTMICIHRPMGGRNGFNNSEWLSDNLKPISTTKSDVLTVTCQYHHLSEFAVIEISLIPPEITTQPPTPTPNITTSPPPTDAPTTPPAVTTITPSTEQLTTSSEPTTVGMAPGGNQLVIVAVIVILTVVVVVIVLICGFCYYRKKRMAKMAIVPEQIELATNNAMVKQDIDEVDGKEPIKVINVDDTGDRREICTVKIVKIIRLRELRNVLIDEFSDDFKDKPFYFLTRHLKEIEPEDETMQFVRVVYEDDEVFVREVTLDKNEATRLHFCICGSVAQFECAECQSQGYCSPDCQGQHWTEAHLKECRTLGEKKRRAAVLNRSRQTSVGQLPGPGTGPLGGRQLPRHDVQSWRGYLNRTTSVPRQPTAALPPVRIPPRYSGAGPLPSLSDAHTGSVGTSPMRGFQNINKLPMRTSVSAGSARDTVKSDGSFQPPVANFPKPSFDQAVPEGPSVRSVIKGDAPSRVSLSRGQSSRPGTTIGSLLEDVREEETGQEEKTDESGEEQSQEKQEREKIGHIKTNLELDGLTESAV